MLLGGLQKTTLIDFPGRIACTVFTVGCNFRCPFCHNKDLVTLENFKKAGLVSIKENDFFGFLKKRKKILEGVTITGGEPLLQPDLPKFCKKIKDLGFEVKVDTNGSRPEVLKELIDKGLVDFIAMDIKSPFDEYQKVTYVKTQNSKLKISIKLILKSGLEYEFRTTVVPGIHDNENLVRLAQQLKSLITNYQLLITDFNYILQQFRPKNCLDPKFLKVKPFSAKEMKQILSAVQKILPKVSLRGVEL